MYVQVREMVSTIVTKPNAESVNYDQFVEIMTVKVCSKFGRKSVVK